MIRTLLLLLLALAVLPAADAIVLTPCVAPYGSGATKGEFLVITEYVVLDALTDVPKAIADKQQVTMVDYLQALGADKPPFEITSDMTEASLIRLEEHRWLIYAQYSSYVRRSAISVIDSKQGLLHYLPPTPAVPGGAGVLAQPHSCGTTLIAASGRIFCGVRSQARVLAVTGKDIDAFARLAAAPTAEDLVMDVADPPTPEPGSPNEHH